MIEGSAVSMVSAPEKNIDHGPAASWAWVAGGVILVLCVVDVILIFRNLPYVPLDEEWGFRGFQAALSLPLSVIGSLIASRHPRNPIGWLFLVSAALGVISEIAGEYAYLASVSETGTLPAADLSAWLTAWIWAPGTAAFLSFSFLYFPNGHLVSPRWRAVLWLSIVGLMGTMLFFAFVPGSSQLSGIENPYALKALAPLQNLFSFLPQSLLLIPALLAAMSLVVRFRQSGGMERQQMKWFVLAAVFAPMAIVIGGFRSPWANLGLVLIVVSIPTAMAVAILRYRLYSIDVIINRTLVYGLLTGTLAVIYFLSVLLLQRILPAQSQLAIVLSTLAVAALFSPLRRRIQRDIDRRFYRQKYDAAQTLARFSQMLRREVDLERLSNALIETVDETMQPAAASIWLRMDAPRDHHD